MMKLEEEIKQKKFQSEFQKAMLNIQFTGNWLMAAWNKFFATFDLTSQQYNVLRILRGHFPEPITSASIQSRMIDKSSNVTRLIDKLVTKKLATSERNVRNKRKVDILITDEGLNLLTRIDVEMKIQENSVRKISDSEAKQLNEILEKMRE